MYVTCTSSQPTRQPFSNKTQNPLISPNLSANTQYFFRLRSDCSGTDADNSNVSEWSEVYTETTGSTASIFALRSDATTSLSPNPSSNFVIVNGMKAVQADIYNANGVMIKMPKNSFQNYSTKRFNNR